MFLSYPFLVSIPIYLVRFMFGTITTCEEMPCHIISRAKIKVMQVVRNVCCALSVVRAFQGFSSYLVQIQPISWRCVLCHFQVKLSKANGSFSVLLYPFRGCISIERLHFIFDTNRNHDWTICRTPFKGETTKTTKLERLLKRLSSTLHGYMPIWKICHKCSP